MPFEALARNLGGIFILEVFLGDVIIYMEKIVVLTCCH
jgi:hypothetical protein